jgi:hypothetical protein
VTGATAVVRQVAIAARLLGVGLVAALEAQVLVRDAPKPPRHERHVLERRRGHVVLGGLLEPASLLEQLERGGNLLAVGNAFLTQRVADDHPENGLIGRDVAG